RVAASLRRFGFVFFATTAPVSVSQAGDAITALSFAPAGRSVHDAHRAEIFVRFRVALMVAATRSVQPASKAMPLASRRSSPAPGNGGASGTAKRPVGHGAGAGRRADAGVVANDESISKRESNIDGTLMSEESTLMPWRGATKNDRLHASRPISGR